MSSAYVAFASVSQRALPAVGIPLGFLIGVLSGALSLLFLRTLQIVRKDSVRVSSLLAQLAGIPALWFSVPFGSKLLTSVPPTRLMTSYVITLALTWVTVIGWPLIRLVIATGAEIGSKSDDD
jgi:hypothetical protein